ncbi:MAG TPA: 6-phosphofructokinase [Fermentimonas caenicola]|jgi:6-phosphofructokinase|uniref:ATP-dependent 6-phosphofructokinase n=1 Tax=Fermentimonas caenicola TaxID=1562970 RepID=A0A098C333_9BACT|nr:MULTISPECIES: ATP-dependent 6-phosphofructokinase [Lascolabacillus]MBP6175950.1 6-phosphofructokinase [Fermentimonas sp.]MDI9625600.1 ATP-dependent 6-phosphofructokinase [Bacteroidota bacterium]TAH62326.1 MAG: 6-phosphofructokinase [Fermentimonas caenicola]MBP6197349.1 6-phosphofructokinase [Fermentimonas sp.]MBP7104286.1 6-phosphofructokinase [Fermentimonas sp.]
MKIGILSSGGDAPGINATIRGVGKTAINNYGMQVIGIQNGFSGLLYKDIVELTDASLSGILNLGGTILGTAREKVFRKMITSPDEKDREQIKAAYQELGLDCLVCIGGNGTQRTTYMLSQLGLNVIGVPKTIDNDVYGTDVTFGFDTAVNIATDAIDRLHSTASSHRRVMVIELMGHHAGWITLYAGMAGGADIILLPELGYNMKVIIDKINKRMELGKAYSIVAVAEGVELPTKERPATYFAREIEEQTGYETRETVLGYIQRGGSPSPSDKILGTLLGGHAADLIHEGKFGRMVAKLGNKISDVPLSEVEGKLRLITPDTDLVVQGKKMGISFGVW